MDQSDLVMSIVFLHKNTFKHLSKRQCLNIRRTTKMHKLNINITNIFDNYLTYVLYIKLLDNIFNLHFAYFDDDPELQELPYIKENYEKLQKDILLSIVNCSKEIQNNLKQLLIITYYIEIYKSYTVIYRPNRNFAKEIAEILIKIFKYYDIASFTIFKYFSNSKYTSNKNINRYIEYFQFYYVNKENIWEDLDINSWIYPTTEQIRNSIYYI